ncbi:hypothetical protein TNCV_2847451 [Trichonephila clavipes]|nr:hypothetical protein TNCV_2847451 [Trichonephila clavipes]
MIMKTYNGAEEAMCCFLFHENHSTVQVRRNIALQYKKKFRKIDTIGAWEIYLDMLQMFHMLITKEKIPEGYIFQQDGARCHYHNDTFELVVEASLAATITISFTAEIQCLRILPDRGPRNSSRQRGRDLRHSLAVALNTIQVTVQFGSGLYKGLFREIAVVPFGSAHFRAYDCSHWKFCAFVCLHPVDF